MNRQEKFKKVRELMDQGVHPIKIAEKLNISRSNAWYWVKKVQPERLVGRYEDHIKHIERLFHEGKTDDEISEATGLANNTIRYYRSRGGLVRRWSMDMDMDKPKTDYATIRFRLLTQDWRGIEV